MSSGTGKRNPEHGRKVFVDGRSVHVLEATGGVQGRQKKAPQGRHKLQGVG
jgi:hypothetical protein